MNKILLEAADLLEDGELGPVWIKGQYTGIDSHGRTTYCAVGALREIYRKYNFANYVEFEAALDMMSKEVGNIHIYNKCTEITVWNDRRIRTAEEVIATMRKAGKRRRPVGAVRRTLRTLWRKFK